MVGPDHRQPADSRTDYLTIAQLAVSGLGMALSLAAAAGLAVLGLILLFGEVADISSTNLLFSTAWISLLVGAMAVPSIIFSIQRLRGAPLNLQRIRLPAGGFRLATLLLLVWPLVLLLGNLVSSEGRLAWLLLPPLQILAAGIPTWWLIEIARRNMQAVSRKRGWGLVNFSVFITTPTLMVVEVLAFAVLLIGFAVWAGSQPALIEEIQSLAQRLMNSPADSDAVLEMLVPYLQNPWVIFGLLAVTAVLVPLIEEFFKPFAVWLLAGRRLSPAEGFVAGALCGAAFALIESLFYLSNPAGDGWAVLAAARAGTILLHITSAALVGWAMAAAWRDGNYWRLGLFYLAAVALHGLWNGMAILSGLSAVLENPPANLRFLLVLARAAPTGIVLLGLLLFAILWGSNHYLHNREKEAAPSLSTKTNPDPFEPYA